MQKITSSILQYLATVALKTHHTIDTFFRQMLKTHPLLSSSSSHPSSSLLSPLLSLLSPPLSSPPPPLLHLASPLSSPFSSSLVSSPLLSPPLLSSPLISSPLSSLFPPPLLYLSPLPFYLSSPSFSPPLSLSLSHSFASLSFLSLTFT